MTERARTSMEFTPKSVVQSVLFDLLSDTTAEEVLEMNMPLALSSVALGRSEEGVRSLTMRRFKKRLNGRYLPLTPLVISRYKPYKDEKDELKMGLGLDVAVYIGDDDDAALEARQLGFADQRNLIMGRLALREEQLASEATHEGTIRRLRSLLAVPPDPRDTLAWVSFIDHSPNSGA